MMPERRGPKGWRVLLVVLTGLAWPVLWAAEADPARQEAYLAELKQVLPDSPAWNQWLDRSGERPPDFEIIPSRPFLPDPMTAMDGSEVPRNDWLRRRQEILQFYLNYILGSMPPVPVIRPNRLPIREEIAILREEVILELAPEGRARLHLELLIPKGEGPFPVVILSRPFRSWGMVAVSRGYLVCLYGQEGVADETASWKTVWPQADWSLLGRRAWAVGRVVDYLEKVPIIDSSMIALMGHGLDGKVALLSAAFDRRIAAAIVSSSGPGGVAPFRLASDSVFEEGLEALTRLHPDWFHPRLRFFAGREEKLPVDQHLLLASMAPRPCLVSLARHDPSENPWAVEAAVRSARSVYAWFDRERALALQYREEPGAVGVSDLESYMDWLDTVFERGYFPIADRFLFPTYDSWKPLADPDLNPSEYPTNDFSKLLLLPNGQEIRNPEEWQFQRERLVNNQFSTLGDAAPFAEGQGKVTLLGTGQGDSAALSSAVTSRRVVFGNHIQARVFYPANAQWTVRKRPAVIWIHPFSPGQGSQAQPPGSPSFPERLAKRGPIVLTFDQIGHGARLEEIRYFYNRYPAWTLLGKMIDDTMAAFGVLSRAEEVDPTRIFLAGHGLGGMVALYAGALEDRCAGVLVTGGLQPLRLDKAEHGTPGLARWSIWFPLHPQRGLFVGQENRFPVDYHELLAILAPRPCTLLVPTLGSSTRPEDLQLMLESAGRVYREMSAGPSLRYLPRREFEFFSAATWDLVLDEVVRLTGQAE